MAEDLELNGLLRQSRIAFLTSASEMPNSRAIRAGVTPALNAAFTAFNLPCGKEGGTIRVYPSIVVL